MSRHGTHQQSVVCPILSTTPLSKLNKYIIRLERHVEVCLQSTIRRWNLIHIHYKLVLSFVFNLFKYSKLIPVNLMYVLLQSKIEPCVSLWNDQKHLLGKFQIHKCPTLRYLTPVDPSPWLCLWTENKGLCYQNKSLLHIIIAFFFLNHHNLDIYYNWTKL